MARRLLVALGALVAAGAILALLPVGSALSQQIQRVLVTNFPELQRVEGQVTVAGGPLRQGQLVRFREVLVSPGISKHATNLTAAGVLDTDGYTAVVLSLSGQVKGNIFAPGVVGALLVPDEEPILQAFDEERRLHFALEVEGPVDHKVSSYFSSGPSRPFVVGFPRYLVYLYNTSDKTAAVNLFAYLAN